MFADGSGRSAASTLEAGDAALVELPRVEDDQQLLTRALAHGPVHEFRRALPTLAEIFREAVS